MVDPFLPRQHDPRSLTKTGSLRHLDSVSLLSRLISLRLTIILIYRSYLHLDLGRVQMFLLLVVPRPDIRLYPYPADRRLTTTCSTFGLDFKREPERDTVSGIFPR
jgi:hypothetical protein